MVIVGAAVLICFLDSMFEVLQGPQTDRPWKHFDSDRDSRDSDSILMMRLRAPATVFSAGKHSRPRRERFAALSESGGGARKIFLF